MSEHEKKSIKGIKIRSLNFGMIFISCILYILLICATIHASHRYEQMVSATEEYISCEEYTKILLESSDFLTEQVRMFVMTRDPVYVDSYFTELNVTRRRDFALEQLEKYHAQDNAYTYLEAALNHSNELAEQEIYALRLIVEAEDYSLEDCPEEIREISLTPQDQNAGPEEMIRRAQDLVFGTSYQEAKQTIRSNVTSSLGGILDDTRQKQTESAIHLKHTMTDQQILISILFIQNIITFVLIIRLIVKPLQIYINNIKNSKMLEISGSYEFKYLALTYNSIYELNSANEAILRYQAQHDPLTGIINRGAFDQLKEVLRVKASPMALLIIDVDKFKLVNDGYGHEIGDKVLIKVARLLEENFRSTDFPARIGGDEFAVILTEVKPEMKPMIANKISSINQTLLNPEEEDLPSVSLSVGGAFSPKGFSQDLYQKADSALYQVKENGRCGCSFYEEPQ